MTEDEAACAINAGLWEPLRGMVKRVAVVPPLPLSRRHRAMVPGLRGPRDEGRDRPAGLSSERPPLPGQSDRRMRSRSMISRSS